MSKARIGLDDDSVTITGGTMYHSPLDGHSVEDAFQSSLGERFGRSFVTGFPNDVVTTFGPIGEQSEVDEVIQNVASALGVDPDTLTGTVSYEPIVADQTIDIDNTTSVKFGGISTAPGIDPSVRKSLYDFSTRYEIRVPNIDLEESEDPVRVIGPDGGVSELIDPPLEEFMDLTEVYQVPPRSPKKEYTGGSVSYYQVEIKDPTTPDRDPYVAECNDIIEALGMTFAEGNAFKAIWRSCAARSLGLSKEGYKDGVYDSEKVVFFGQRMVVSAKRQQS